MKLRQEDFFIPSEFCISCEGEDSYNSTSEQLAGKRGRDDMVCEIMCPARFNPSSAFAFLG